MDIFLQSTEFLDYQHPAVQAFALENTIGAQTDKEKAIQLFYAVRDKIRYDPYRITLSPEGMKASTTLSNGYGFCITKAVLLAAVARCAGIHARLGFADVTNHLTTQKLKQTMGTDLFVYHGYTELWLQDKWIKATPTFNLSLCTRFNVMPLDFDGENDSMLHPFDASGKKHLEYIRYHGSFVDLPFQTIADAFTATYPNHFRDASNQFNGDFHREAELENRLKP